MSYNIFSYMELESRAQKHLVVPQRCGSSFTKTIIDEFKPVERSYLEQLDVTGNYPSHILREEDRHWLNDMNFYHVSLSSATDLNIVYRHPVARYASGLTVLLPETWEHFIDWFQTADLSHEKPDRLVAEGYTRIMGMPIESLYGDAENHKQHYFYGLDRMLDTAIKAHPFSPINIFWEPTFGEPHCRPVMLQTAVLACISEQPTFTELEDFTNWAEHAILTNGNVFPNKHDMQSQQQWHNGRAHMPRGTSDVPTDAAAYCLDYLKQHLPQAFDISSQPGGEETMFPLTFDRWIAPDLDVYNYIYARGGQFDDREVLIDFLVSVFEKYPYAITRNMYFVNWFSSKYTLDTLPPRLADAIRDNLKAGIQLINDRTFFHVADYINRSS